MWHPTHRVPPVSATATYKGVIMKALRSVLPGWLAARIFAVSGWADVTGTILGVVRDQSGGVVPNVEIKATHLETNQTRPTRTDTAGEYRILALPAGKYRIEAAAEMLKDCTHSLDYPHLRSEIRVFWTDQRLYLLFTCPYKKLNLFLPLNQTARETNSGTGMSSRCSSVPTGIASRTTGSSRSLRQGTGSIWRSTSTAKAMTATGASEG